MLLLIVLEEYCKYCVVDIDANLKFGTNIIKIYFESYKILALQIAHQWTLMELYETIYLARIEYACRIQLNSRKHLKYC